MNRRDLLKAAPAVAAASLTGSIATAEPKSTDSRMAISRWGNCKPNSLLYIIMLDNQMNRQFQPPDVWRIHDEWFHVVTEKGYDDLTLAHPICVPRAPFVLQWEQARWRFANNPRLDLRGLGMPLGLIPTITHKGTAIKDLLSQIPPPAELKRHAIDERVVPKGTGIQYVIAHPVVQELFAAYWRDFLLNEMQIRIHAVEDGVLELI